MNIPLRRAISQVNYNALYPCSLFFYLQQDMKLC
jgi:hypothetical protein